MKAVVLGATRGMGRAVARRLAERGDEVFVLARDRASAESACADLSARGGRRVAWAACDLARPETFAPALTKAEKALAGLDAVVVTAGAFASQDEFERDPRRLRAMLEANFTSTVLFCEEARARLLARGGGTLVAFSSVAGERGRKPVLLYGAAKAGLTRYLEGLDHKFHSKGLRVVTVKPGFVRTDMTAGLKPPPFAGDPDGVAARVVAAMDRGTPVVYAPPIWALVMFVIRHLPRFVMRRIGF